MIPAEKGLESSADIGRPVSGGAAARRSAGLAAASAWEGPLPPPDALEAFERAHPGTAERIVTMAERTQAVQAEIALSELRNEREATRRGQWLGFALPCLFAAGAVTSAWLGLGPWLPLILATVPALSAVNAIVHGRQQRDDPRGDTGV